MMSALRVTLRFRLAFCASIVHNVRRSLGDNRPGTTDLVNHIRRRRQNVRKANEQEPS